jgi:dTMP kinase
MRASLSRITAVGAGRRASAPQPAHGLSGWFIAVEGGDGAGKSTQVEALAGWLRGRGFDVVTTREPGATELGAKLRELLLHAEDREPVGARAEALLFAADRADHVEKVVRPALRRGAIVLTDRHVDSSVAYQSGGRGLPAQDVVALSAFATDGLRPDLVILLDLDPAAAWERTQTRGDGPDRLEAEPAEFHKKVRQVFRDRAAAEPSRYLVVDAAEPPGVITAIIEDRLEEVLPLSVREAAEARERERALKEAQEAERRDREFKLAAERAAAEKEAERQRAELEKAREQEEKRREQARQEHARRAAEERARFEEQKAEQRRREEADRKAAELRDAELREQAAADAEHRREAEMKVRQAEARAKALAREQAARALGGRAESEVRIARLVEAARQEQAPAAAPAEPAQDGEGGKTDETAVLPIDLSPTQVLPGKPLRHQPQRDDDDEYDDDDDDDAPRSRWRLGMGKRKP